MVERRNLETGLLEIQIPAVVAEIRQEVLKLKNHKETPYRLGTTKIRYPDGGEGEVLTRFYSKSIEAHPDVFRAGERISIIIQAEGDYAGRAVASLPGSSVDLARLIGKNLEKPSILEPSSESKLKDHLVDEEAVV
ncbi:hypothetical protein [Seonamhaeicola sp. ML3]|uniref:hypothetical protein n=1 Tax=Seonamhaeicola sp. ML3 TaxID=2937786 RepID=UPI00200EBFAD|nr:hypothetical protein [Seonamhaeicola sp. ML3]